jgi:hypothetical protein
MQISALDTIQDAAYSTLDSVLPSMISSTLPSTLPSMLPSMLPSILLTTLANYSNSMSSRHQAPGGVMGAPSGERRVAGVWQVGYEGWPKS